MKNRQSEEFQLIDLRNHPEVLSQLTQFEQEINQMIDGKVALIAYVNNEKKA